MARPRTRGPDDHDAIGLLDRMALFRRDTADALGISHQRAAAAVPSLTAVRRSRELQFAPSRSRLASLRLCVVARFVEQGTGAHLCGAGPNTRIALWIVSNRAIGQV